jgi:hypothetical protein
LRDGAYFSTGRDALISLLASGRSEYGWKRLWLPGYYCPDVVRSLIPLGLELRAYASLPGGPPDIRELPTRVGDVVLLVNLFGLLGGSGLPAASLRSPTDSRQRNLDRIVVVEDHTHDPLSLWARRSTSDWCFASLRKTLPLPDGGVIWSPAGHPLPRPPALTLHRRLASLEMLAAMTLRGDLGRHHDNRGPRDHREPGDHRGSTTNADTVRDLELKAEARLQSGSPCGMPTWTREMLAQTPVDDLRRKRRAAHLSLTRALGDQAGPRILQPARSGPAACPFPTVLEYPAGAARDAALRSLEESGVEALVLWPLGESPLVGIAQREIELSHRMVALPHLERLSRAALASLGRLLRTT